MLTTPQIAPRHLGELCRALQHALAAGVPLVKAFAQQAQSGPPPVRPVAAAVTRDLTRGDSLETALNQHQACLPPLLLALAAVGEQSGALPVVFRALERHFLRQHRLRQQLQRQCARPALQFGIAVLILAGLTWILGVIGENSGTPALDPLGLGVTGARGAALLLALVGAFLAALAGLAFLAVQLARQPAGAAQLLGVPLVGACWQALTLGRLATALHLTLPTGMPLRQALTLSLRATGNPAFTARLPEVLAAAAAGRELTTCLAQTQLLPRDFQQTLAVAEASGQVPEVMAQQAERCQDEAERRLEQGTRAAAFLIWLLMAVLVTWAILSIFINVYLGPWSAFS